jgi:hypothetical protein
MAKIIKLGYSHPERTIVRRYRMDDTRTRHTIRIKPIKIALALLFVSFVIMILSLLGQQFRFFGQYRINPVQDYLLKMFIHQFFVNDEGNITTYWKVLLLIMMAALTFIIASAKFAQKDRYRFEWWLLGAVFSYLSVDEASIIHEKFSALLKSLPDLNGWAHYRWLYAGAAAVIFLTLVFIRFYLHLDLSYKILFPLSAAVYILGAAGGELFSGHYAQYYGTKNITYTLMTHGEEFGQHFGSIMMVFTLLTYLVAHYPKIGFTTQETEKPSGTSA